ncbi:DUF6221 family protein [Prauserella endophytica]|uniref:Uncharacterized protein n=1 Tax=Prauserella endophytica TaxID=1592324 RepID=A0ABY2RUG8_9PSEU|nr:DUF6221 family protein [Prauserella endophytica]TKG58877.1 hypothetical protein FCN18_37310 [Prauserella endophytica]
MNTLVEFLQARLAEDERVLRAAEGGHWEVSTIDGSSEIRETVTRLGVVYSFSGGCTDPDTAEHIVRHDPVHVLRDIESKRRIIDEHPLDSNALHEPLCRTCASGTNDGDLEGEWPCPTLRLLALPYADHPDYQEEWRP